MANESHGKKLNNILLQLVYNIYNFLNLEKYNFLVILDTLFKTHKVNR